MMQRIVLAVLFLITAPLRGDAAKDIDAFARKALDVVGSPPGLAIVVVKDDRVVYRGEFGLRDVEAKLPVTPETRFYIASSTKAFTAMTALILAQEGKLDLDAPLTTYWPELVLTPPLDAKRFSIRDFLAMRPGLQNNTYNYRSGAAGNIAGEEELLHILATYSQERPRTFQYSNMSYELAAEIMERAAGKRWQDLTAEKVFAPLGMTAATSDVPAGVPVAQLYDSTAHGAFERNRGKTNATMGPAGGTFLTTADAAKWIIAMLNDGRLDGRQVLPARAVRTAQSAQTVQKAKFHYFDRWGWGIGQDLGEYEGELLVHRFGGFNGAFSHISWMPDRRIGVAVFSNGGSAAADAVAAYAYDVMLGKKDLDAKWSPELEKIAAAVQKQRDERKAAAAIARREPGRPLAAYAGAYLSDRLGRIEVEAAGGKLWGTHGILRAEFIPIGGDEFRVDWSDEGAFDPLKFVVGTEGRVTGFDWGGREFGRVP